ncbi:Hypothetical_protein [Hexamita inflata]|uniref:Hypothetical_protein n=1 Tax=Hexamita inflata TaxID=28002 RepID=A0AA86RPH4_9EUKA|nr:Hypothetical protein HINF_LOCUS64898 [Hexamita inflata]
MSRNYCKQSQWVKNSNRCEFNIVTAACQILEQEKVMACANLEDYIHNLQYMPVQFVSSTPPFVARVHCVPVLDLQMNEWPQFPTLTTSFPLGSVDLGFGLRRTISNLEFTSFTSVWPHYSFLLFQLIPDKTRKLLQVLTCLKLINNYYMVIAHQQFQIADIDQLHVSEILDLIRRTISNRLFAKFMSAKWMQLIQKYSHWGTCRIRCCSPSVSLLSPEVHELHHDVVLEQVSAGLLQEQLGERGRLHLRAGLVQLLDGQLVFSGDLGVEEDLRETGAEEVVQLLLGLGGHHAGDPVPELLGGVGLDGLVHQEAQLSVGDVGRNRLPEVSAHLGQGGSEEGLCLEHLRGGLLRLRGGGREALGREPGLGVERALGLSADEGAQAGVVLLQGLGAALVDLGHGGPELLGLGAAQLGDHLDHVFQGGVLGGGPGEGVSEGLDGGKSRELELDWVEGEGGGGVHLLWRWETAKTGIFRQLAGRSVFISKSQIIFIQDYLVVYKVFGKYFAQAISGPQQQKYTAIQNESGNSIRTRFTRKCMCLDLRLFQNTNPPVIGFCNVIKL